MLHHCDLPMRISPPEGGLIAKEGIKVRYDQVLRGQAEEVVD
jgi:hypothetical protein